MIVRTVLARSDLRQSWKQWELGQGLATGIWEWEVGVSCWIQWRIVDQQGTTAVIIVDRARQVRELLALVSLPDLPPHANVTVLAFKV